MIVTLFIHEPGTGCCPDKQCVFNDITEMKEVFDDLFLYSGKKIVVAHPIRYIDEIRIEGDSK